MPAAGSVDWGDEAEKEKFLQPIRDGSIEPINKMRGTFKHHQPGLEVTIIIFKKKNYVLL